MSTRKFLTSVADVYAYDDNDNIVFTGKTLLDSSIEVSLGSAPVRGGRGNQLQYIYYHTGEMKFTLTDTQWNLAMLEATVGSGEELGSYYKEENVAVVSGSGTVSKTPLAFESGDTVYGWATDVAGNTTRVVINNSTKKFNIAPDGNYCVRYYTANSSVGKSITIKANMIPKVVKLVMETQLNSADVTTNKIGMVQIIAPSVTLSGAFTISMKADGVANTPLTGTALAYSPVAGTDACANEPYYAKIIEIIDATNWYDNVIALAIEEGDFSIANGQSKTLSVWAIPSIGSAFKVTTSSGSQITFSVVQGTSATVGANTGVVTTSTTGSSIIKALITSASSIETDIVVTVV